MFFAKALFRIKLAFMRGLEGILSPITSTGASWAELGPTWAPKRAQKGGQDEAKTIRKPHLFFSSIYVPIFEAICCDPKSQSQKKVGGTAIRVAGFQFTEAVNYCRKKSKKVTREIFRWILNTPCRAAPGAADLKA